MAVAWVGIIITLGIAIVGWSRANRAERHAVGADDRAARALELAESAEARAQRLEAAQFERAEIRWEPYWSENDRVLAVRNVGVDAAHQVELVVDPLRDTPGLRKQTSEAIVKPTGFIGIDLSRTVGAATSSAAKARARRKGAEINLAVRVQLTWRTETGAVGADRWDEIDLLNLWAGSEV